MRITEIQSIPKEIRNIKSSNPSAAFARAEKLLISQGYKEIGAGGFGKVFTYRDDKVIKLFREGDGYLRWVKYCRDNPENPWLMKCQAPTQLAEGVYTVVIEDLQQLEKHQTKFIVAFASSVYASALGKPLKTEIQTLIEKDPHLASLFEFFASQPRSLDLQTHNTMRRGDQIVFVDPLKR